MIYVSSSCLKSKSITHAIECLEKMGFKNIELSGGTYSYKDITEDLIGLKERLGLRYFCHNYFASPREEFVVNLGSLNDAVYEKSIEHLKSAIKISSLIGAKKFGIHAGFFLDPTIEQFGDNIPLVPLFDREKSINRFCEGYKILKSVSGDVELYIENNAYSFLCSKRYGKDTLPFMLLHYGDFVNLRKRLDFKMLLDVAHLKVSSNSLGLDYFGELMNMFVETDYIHLSHTMGIHDQHERISINDPILDIFKTKGLKGKDITLEIYGDMEGLIESRDIIERKLA